jgi:protein gp37
MSDGYWKQPIKWDKKAGELGVRYKVFCSSMADWAEDNPTIEEQRRRLFPLIKSTPNLDWQLLSKRFDNIKNCLPKNWGNGYDNVLLGLSFGTQKLAEEYLDEFLLNKARRIFFSIEPLLERIDISKWLITGKISQVIVGGESGPKKRSFDCDWARDIRDQCKEAGVPFFFKQVDKVRPIPKDLQIREYPYGKP